MNKLTGLFGALILGLTLTTTTLAPRDANALGGLLFGQPVLIGFSNDHLVNRIEVQVNRGWLNSDNFSLAITIDGVNHGDHSHGYQEVQLSATEVLGTERAITLVTIPWTTDSTPTSSPEKYTACVQILVNGNSLGDEMCAPMGEY